MDAMNSPTSFLKGHFLMAMPALADPNFRQSVTCIAEHGEEGALGIVINRLREPISGRIIFDELKIACSTQAEQIPIHNGGPVHPNELFVLHGPPMDWGGSLIIADNLGLSNSRSILEAIAIGEGPRDFVITLGCAGWGPGQLEYEMGQNAWLTIAACHDIIFSVPIDERWDAAIRRLGIDPQLLSDTAGHA
jgi:putative transcriptional regulator